MRPGPFHHAPECPVRQRPPGECTCPGSAANQLRAALPNSGQSVTSLIAMVDAGIADHRRMYAPHERSLMAPVPVKTWEAVKKERQELIAAARDVIKNRGDIAPLLRLKRLLPGDGNSHE